MTVGKWVTAILWAFFCPGAGQAAMGKRAPAVVWMCLALGSLLAVPLTIWAVFAMMAARLGAVADAVVRILLARPARLEWNLLAGVATGAAVAGLAFYILFLETFLFPTSSMHPTVHSGDQFVVERLTLLWREPARGELVVFEHPCEHVKFMKRVIAIGNDTVEIRCSVVHVNGAAIPHELVEGATCVEKIGDGSPQRCSRYRETLDGHSYEVLHDPERPQRDEERRRTGRAEPDPHDFPWPDRQTSCPQPSEQPMGKLVPTRTGSEETPCEPHLHFEVPPGSLFVLGDNRSGSRDSRSWGVVPVSNVHGRVVGIYRPLSRIGDR